MLQFAQPAALLALAGLAVPVLIHLIQRKLARPLRFPSVRFIPRAPVPRQGRRRIHDFVLLLLRMLLYASLILILAQPFWEPERETAGVTGEPATVVLLDASASMSGWGAWDSAVSAARDVVSNASGPVSVITFADQVLQSSGPALSTSEAQTILSSATPRLVEGDPSVALREALESLQGRSGRIVVISDFQAQNWTDISWPPLSEGVAVEAVRVGADRGGNLALRIARSFPVDAENKRVLAEVTNLSEEAESVPVVLTADGQDWLRVVEVKPGATTSVVFEIPPPTDPIGVVKLPDDVYQPDNLYHLWVGARPNLPVSVFVPEGVFDAEEAFFISRALEIHRPSDWLRFSPMELGLSFLEERQLGNTAAIAITGAASGSGDIDWGLVRRYIEEGGAALVTLDRDAVKTLRELRGANLFNARYSGVRGSTEEATSRYPIAWINPESRLAEVFHGDAARDLFLLDLRRYVQLANVEDAIELLRTENGDPILLRRSIGRGQLFISTFPWDTRWSDLPLRNAFLPLAHEVFSWAGRDDEGILRLDVGEVVQDPAGPATPPTSFGEPGVYLLGDTPVEVNVTRTESAPEVILTSEWEDAIGRAGRAAAAAASVDTAAEDQNIPLWPWLACFAFLMLLSETLLASLFSPDTANARSRGTTPETSPRIP